MGLTSLFLAPALPKTPPPTHPPTGILFQSVRSLAPLLGTLGDAAFPPSLPQAEQDLVLWRRQRALVMNSGSTVAWAGRAESRWAEAKNAASSGG